MHLAGLAAVLERVARDNRLVGELALLAHRNESDAEIVRHSTRGNKPARVDPDHRVDLLAFVSVGESVDGNPKEPSVLQNRGDVLEEDSLDWKIRHVTDSGFQFLIHGRWSQWTASAFVMDSA